MTISIFYPLFLFVSLNYINCLIKIIISRFQYFYSRSECSHRVLMIYIENRLTSLVLLGTVIGFGRMQVWKNEMLLRLLKFNNFYSYFLKEMISMTKNTKVWKRKLLIKSKNSDWRWTVWIKAMSHLTLKYHQCEVYVVLPKPPVFLRLFVFFFQKYFQFNSIDDKECHRIIIQYGWNDSNIRWPEFGWICITIDVAWSKF